jgi:uncharacterized LabA/DUF88 family protein
VIGYGWRKCLRIVIEVSFLRLFDFDSSMQQYLCRMKEKNIAFVDGQNLHLGTDWEIDYARFRVYLRDKYRVETAYYYFGYVDENQQSLYTNLQKAGFVIVFKEHNRFMQGKKKGNVDSDIIFEAMKALIDDDFDRMLLVSGDGDYKKLVDYLIDKDRFKKILFPNKKYASSLYKKLGFCYYDYLAAVKHKFEYQKKRRVP